jgi:hypothetical protein
MLPAFQRLPLEYWHTNAFFQAVLVETMKLTLGDPGQWLKFVALALLTVIGSLWATMSRLLYQTPLGWHTACSDPPTSVSAIMMPCTSIEPAHSQHQRQRTAE